MLLRDLPLGSDGSDGEINESSDVIKSKSFQVHTWYVQIPSLQCLDVGHLGRKPANPAIISRFFADATAVQDGVIGRLCDSLHNEGHWDLVMDHPSRASWESSRLSAITLDNTSGGTPSQQNAAGYSTGSGP